MSDMHLKESFSLESHISELKKMDRHVEAFAEAAGLSMKDTFSLNLSLEELVSNIIKYGGEAGKAHEINLQLSIDASQLEIIISDSGSPFDPSKANTPDVSLSLDERAIGGLGVFLVNKFMDSMQYERSDTHNILHLTKQLS